MNYNCNYVANMVKSAYIHIPFCKQKCNYCTFVSFSQLELQTKYIEALLKEIKNGYNGETLDTIYFGGGTPSLLKIEHFIQLLKSFNFSDTTEITAEINPETVDENYLHKLREIGVNRLSIGIQTFDDNILKIIGRGHNAKTAIETVKTAKTAGFNNISVDLIYGLPNQTLNNFKNSLEIALSLDIQHISLYGLKIEKGCYFYVNRPENLPNDDAQADYYLFAVKTCQKNGFEHYEISNFARPKFYSRHNLNYWNNKNYYGFGCSASGYENNLRYYNEPDLKKYIENPLLRMHTDILTPKQQLEEEIFLGFRKAEGIDVGKIMTKFSIDFKKIYSEPLKKYLGKYILKTEKGYKFSDKGFLVSNIILAEFLE